ncbi:MAG TPA: histidinol-phosphatase [Stellaceae bacterium]|jgi:inositol-phosphate phosphatase/L-galactose 1-phosphate phosphatase/histidinol-phosphatase|nr:histidinol-phosphatase [Stellaceae bacterium]
MIGAAEIDLAEQLAEAAGEIARRYFRQPIAIEDKPDQTPVTVADREAEAAMRALIEARFPADGIVGEEYGAARADAARVWVLDPIDGTKSFIAGIPLFGILVALVENGAPALGVIDQPILRERWVGVAGQGTRRNGVAVHTRVCGDLAAASLYATSPDMFGADRAAFARLAGAVKGTRFGADCYAYAQLASGFIDLVVEADLKPYDYCALVPVIEGAGGIVTDWQGNKLGLQSDGRVVAAGDPALAAKARAVLTGN